LKEIREIKRITKKRGENSNREQGARLARLGEGLDREKNQLQRDSGGFENQHKQKKRKKATVAPKKISRVEGSQRRKEKGHEGPLKIMRKL